MAGVRSSCTMAFLIALIAVSFIASACGDSDGGDDGGPAVGASDDDTESGDTESGDSDTDDANGDADQDDDGGGDGVTPAGDVAGQVTVDEGTFDVVIDSCLLPAVDNDPFGMSATTVDGRGELSAAGIAGLGTLGFDVDDGEIVWVAVAAAVVFDGTTISYDGPALKTSIDGAPPETTMSFTVTC